MGDGGGGEVGGGDVCLGRTIKSYHLSYGNHHGVERETLARSAGRSDDADATRKDKVGCVSGEGRERGDADPEEEALLTVVGLPPGYSVICCGPHTLRSTCTVWHSESFKLLIFSDVPVIVSIARTSATVFLLSTLSPSCFRSRCCVCVDRSEKESASTGACFALLRVWVGWEGKWGWGGDVVNMQREDGGHGEEEEEVEFALVLLAVQAVVIEAGGGPSCLVGPPVLPSRLFPVSDP